ncbi:hypothetical protein RFI_32358 [Reticulomyxa filosa]|uniref:Uncharacterized protein n=1 Tax=Reticulomyxa filosa TaxID=46433 RepID=X6LSZ4_RETFI|nr:hypothetical protein RFI_32358 [Reticulomyxa filosa]|eukprot:ETO05038.1 hypothetical protein RFI_32358 [Reticulomyxa filosa]
MIEKTLTKHSKGLDMTLVLIIAVLIALLMVVCVAFGWYYFRTKLAMKAIKQTQQHVSDMTAPQQELSPKQQKFVAGCLKLTCIKKNKQTNKKVRHATRVTVGSDKNKEEEGEKGMEGVEGEVRVDLASFLAHSNIQPQPNVSIVTPQDDSDNEEEEENDNDDGNNGNTNETQTTAQGEVRISDVADNVNVNAKEKKQRDEESRSASRKASEMFEPVENPSNDPATITSAPDLTFS